MAGAIMNKLWETLGMGNDREEDEDFENEIDYDYDEYEEDEENEGRGIFGNLGRKNREKIVAMPQTQSIKMVI